MADIYAAHGICSAIRPKLLTALGPYGFRNLQIEAWAQDEDGRNRRSDEDSMAALHVARITVNDAAAEWCEYLVCRYAAAYPGTGLRLMSKPLNPRNQRWAAKWDTLPPCWRQKDCKVVLPPQPSKAGKRPARRQPAKPTATRRKRQAQPAKQRGWLATLRRLW